MIEFTAWPKTPRLFKGMTVTEKIDGSNAAIHIRPATDDSLTTHTYTDEDGDPWEVIAQSRKRLLVGVDNFAFAEWVHNNAGDLVELLGEGLHFGEWWGSGIQRGYGLTNGERRFSLFNVDKYEGIEEVSNGLLRTVPVICRYTRFETWAAERCLDFLKERGSLAAPGFAEPEGVIVWHEAARHCFKLTFDDNPKGSDNV